MKFCVTPSTPHTDGHGRSIVTCNKSLWVFHGVKDTAVKVTMSTDMVEAIQTAGSNRVRLTVYPDLEHDSWTVTYDNMELYQ